ncbi:MAG: SRPBCC family protein [Ilumatobacter sp.]|uniref:SRPBCC family protein n=1 Tax=Ilumatobacter sp. TaxID=1967498 RepID=UPI00261E7126|nr:SRPBCC family protein [Ilumatobacter sp.]MDJ0768950.1 SRPBCC family protein [Ilumatobacter sp.]
MTQADVDFVDRAPLVITTELSLRQPPQAVWDVLTDNESWPDWFRSCKACRTTSEARTGVGSTRWIHVDLFKVNERIIAWDEPHRWGFTLVDANVPIAETVVELAELTPDGNGTKIVYRFAVELKPWMRPLRPVMRWRFERLFASSLAGLQPYLDAR